MTTIETDVSTTTTAPGALMTPCELLEAASVETRQLVLPAMRTELADISVSCALGAELAGADAATVDLFAWCGDRLGLAFQIVDDVPGIWGDARMTGKPVSSDLRARKKSCPVLCALNGSSPAAARPREIYLGTGRLLERRISPRREHDTLLAIVAAMTDRVR